MFTLHIKANLINNLRLKCLIVERKINCIQVEDDIFGFAFQHIFFCIKKLWMLNNENKNENM